MNINQYGTIRTGVPVQQQSQLGFSGNVNSNGVSGVDFRQYNALAQNGALGGLKDPSSAFQQPKGFMGNLGEWGGKIGDWLSEGDNLSTLANIGGTIAGLYLGNKQLKMGEKAFGLQEAAFNNNLAHNIQSYNTKLADQAKARGYTQGQSQSDIDAHIEKNSLKRI